MPDPAIACVRGVWCVVMAIIARARVVMCGVCRHGGPMQGGQDAPPLGFVMPVIIMCYDIDKIMVLRFGVWLFV